MALSQDRMTKRRDGKRFNDPVAAATILYVGALVCLNAAGNAVPGATATGLVARGICTERADNASGDAGDQHVDTEPGVFAFKNSAAADEIDRSHIGELAYIVDDETVAATHATNTRSVAGSIVDVDSDGVWVRVGQ